MKRVTAYQSEDGQIHTSRDACRRADARSVIRSIIDDECIGSGGNWSGAMVADSLIERSRPRASLRGAGEGAQGVSERDRGIGGHSSQLTSRSCKGFREAKAPRPVRRYSRQGR